MISQSSVNSTDTALKTLGAAAMRGELALLIMDREQIEMTLGRLMSDSEWAEISPHLQAIFDEDFWYQVNTNVQTLLSECGIYLSDEDEDY